MKKLFLMIFIFFILTLNANAISANSVTVMDSDTKRILYSHNGDEKRLIASITKIMTSLVAIKNSNINDIVEINESVLKSYGSGIYVEVGEQISLEDLLYGLMLRSGNDAAIAIADYVSGSMEKFSELMNEMATSIGMKSTTFINSSGLENDKGIGNISTSNDMALLMSEALKNKIFQKIVRTKKHTVKTNYKTYIWHNKNKLLSNYKYCTGGKTGFTEKERRTLVTSATKDNMNLVIVTLNDPNDFKDHEDLYNKYFSLYKSYKIIDKNTTFEKKDYYIKNDIYLTLTNDEYKLVETDINYYKKNTSNIVGYINLKLNNKVLKKEFIYVKKKNIKKVKKNFIDKIKNFFKK